MLLLQCHVHLATEEAHRPKIPDARLYHPACVARPVKKDELEASDEAKGARDKEWQRLWEKDVWDPESVMEWDDVARIARTKWRRNPSGQTIWLLRPKGQRAT